jgi:hypothetical protein
MRCRTHPVHAGQCGCLSSDISIGGDCGSVAAGSQLQAFADSVHAPMRPDLG